MTTFNTLRNKVVADEREPNDVLVYVGWTGQADDNGVRQRFKTKYMPIAEYQACIDWAVSIADQMAHPLYVVPLSANDILRTERWTPYANMLANLNDQQWGELRQVVIATCASIMRDCDDRQLRAECFDILVQLKVIHQ
jgi:hypothetical protein